MPAQIRPPNFSPQPSAAELAEYLKEVYVALNQLNGAISSLISQAQALSVRIAKLGG